MAQSYTLWLDEGMDPEVLIGQLYNIMDCIKHKSIAFYFSQRTYKYTNQCDENKIYSTMHSYISLHPNDTTEYKSR